MSSNIEGVRFRSRATGILMPKNLNLEASMKKATVVDYKKPADDSGDDGE